MDRECPYCEWRGRGRRFVLHVLTFHRNRLRAHRVYLQAIEAGADEMTARVAYNRALAKLYGGPGRYERSAVA